MTVFDQLEEVNKDQLAPFYLLYGEEDDLLNNIKDDLSKKLDFSKDDLSQSYFDMPISDGNQVLEDLESLPFFDDKRLVIIENLWDITTSKKSTLDEGQLKRLEAYIDNPVETTVLVIVVHGKVDNKRRLVKKLKKVSQVFEAQPLSEMELLNYFSKELEDSKLDLSSHILKRIFEKSNNNFGPIKQNIDLLKLYKSSGSVTLEEVDYILPKTLQDNIFDLTDLLLKGKINEAQTLVDDLRFQGEEVIKLLAILLGNFRLYYQTKLLLEKSWSQKQISDFLKIHPYRIKLACTVVKSLAKSELEKIILSLIDLDFKIKTSYADKNYLFDLELIKIAKRHTI